MQSTFCCYCCCRRFGCHRRLLSWLLFADFQYTPHNQAIRRLLNKELGVIFNVTGCVFIILHIICIELKSFIVIKFEIIYCPIQLNESLTQAICDVLSLCVDCMKQRKSISITKNRGKQSICKLVVLKQYTSNTHSIAQQQLENAEKTCTLHSST